MTVCMTYLSVRYVCFMFGFQTWSPCKGMISPNLLNCNNKQFLVQRSGDSSHAPSEHLKLHLENLKRSECQNLKVLKSLALCSNFLNFTCKCSDGTRSFAAFYVHALKTQILDAAGRRKLIHFACLFESTQMWNLANMRKVSESWYLSFEFSKFHLQALRCGRGHPVTHTKILTAPDRRKLRHFANCLKAIRSGILQFVKNCSILRSSGIWPFFEFSKFHI